MQALYDFLPLIAFFSTYWLAGIYAATGVLMAVTVLVALLQWLKRRKVSPMLLVSAGLALVFGGLTLYFHNQLFIQWKMTIADVLFALILLASQFFGDEPMLKKVMGHVLKTDDKTWRTANTAWALFFLATGAVNLVFVYGFSVDAWVKWKFASFILLALFTLAGSAWLANRAEATEN